jgi:drug/metabolite transporter (DMT)-like permease
MEDKVLGILFGFLSSVLWGINGVFLRKGLEKADVVSGTFTIVLISTIVSFLFASFDFQSTEIKIHNILMLSCAGALSYFVGRLLTYFSVSIIGSSRAFSGTSTRIMFSAVFGVLVLKEILNFNIFTGSLMMITGLTIFSTEGFDRKGIYASVLGGLIYGISSLLIKLGMLSSVFVSNFIAFTSGLIFISLFAFLKKKLIFEKNKYIVLSSLSLSLGQISFYFALSLAPLTIVVPLSNLYPLGTTFLSYIFIQKLEKIRLKTLIGSILTVTGSLFIVLGY